MIHQSNTVSDFQLSTQGFSMRRLLLIGLLTLTVSIEQAEARLFWQTFGSVVPDGQGSLTWNWNQDYFIPRHADTGRYGLFSPCKHSHTTSPACRTCHPLFPGYCSNFGPCHYAWRNHVYRSHCGASPVKPYLGPYKHASKCHGRAGCSQGCDRYGRSVGHGERPCENLAGPAWAAEYLYLPNVDSRGFVVLGSIPADGNNLLAHLDLDGSLGLPAPGLEPRHPPAAAPATENQQPLWRLNLPEINDETSQLILP